MKLEFDSIHELEQFFMFSAHIGQAFTAQGQPPAAVEREPVRPIPADVRAAMMQDFSNDPDGVACAPDAAEPDYSADTQTGAPKRKRRTKAEIAADEVAALQARGDSGDLAVAATQALAEPVPLEDPAPAPVEVSGIDHLLSCQLFIQAHGMHKYNESFRDGLTANIATYTAEQRAQHVGVLQSLAA